MNSSPIITCFAESLGDARVVQKEDIEARQCGGEKREF